MGPDGQMMTKNAYKKLMKKLEKDKKKAEHKKKNQDGKEGAQETKKAEKKEEEQEEYVKDPNDPCAHLFGDRELIRSNWNPDIRFEKKYHHVKDLTDALKDEIVTIRARASRMTGKGSAAFIVLRDRYHTAQACIFCWGRN